MSQTPFCVICGEIADWYLPVYAVNDTNEPVSGKVRIADGETNETLHEGGFGAGVNGISQICGLPMMYSDKRLLLMEWETDGGETGFNHYICGMPPFSLEQYKGWLGILRCKAGF
jgi:hypothetical protein